MSPARTKLLTAEEFAAQYGGDYVELIDGAIKELPKPKTPHGFICAQLTTALTMHVMAKDLGRVVCNDTFVLTRRNPDRVRGADICYWSYDRLPKSAPLPAIVEAPPELVVEVRSPSDRSSELLFKVAEYLDAGVNLVVVVDPGIAAVTVYRQDEYQQVFDNGDVLVFPDILPGFSIPVAKLFG